MKVVEYVVEAKLEDDDPEGIKDMLDAITDALNESGILAYVYQKKEGRPYD